MKKSFRRFSTLFAIATFVIVSVAFVLPSTSLFAEGWGNSFGGLGTQGAGDPTIHGACAGLVVHDEDENIPELTDHVLVVDPNQPPDWERRRILCHFPEGQEKGHRHSDGVTTYPHNEDLTQPQVRCVAHCRRWLYHHLHECTPETVRREAWPHSDCKEDTDAPTDLVTSAAEEIRQMDPDSTSIL